MSGWLRFLILSFAQAHLVTLTVDSALMGKIRPRLPRFLQQLTSCPMCTGFWAAELLSIANSTGVFTVPLALGFFGGLLYLAKEKFLPCSKCKAEVGTWKVI
jgi:hypothetical protein